MSRFPCALLLGAALLTAAAGCRTNCGSSCNDRHSWFTSNSRSNVPCQLVGNGKLLDGCYDPISGQPVPCPPPTTVIPGGSYPGGSYPGVLPRADELPFPGPADMIPAPGVPSAPPQPAPAPFGGASANPKNATAVKGTTKQ
jgi:hypothetical protein